MPAKLTDLDVDRVDAVDRPATRRKFLILKDETGGTPASEDPIAQAKRLLAAAAKAVGMIHASKAEHPAEMADALNELAEASGAEQRFTKAVEKPADEPAKTPETKAETPAPFDAAAFAAAIGPAIGDAVVKALKADLEKDESGAVTRGTPETVVPASKQDTEPVTKRAPRGVDFSNIVFGRASGLNG